MARPPALIDLPLTLSPDGPLRHRIADAVVAAIAQGRLRPGDALPSTRALAEQLGVSRGSVVAGYDELASAGFVQALAGGATRVTGGADLAARTGVRTHAVPRRPTPPTTAPAPEPRWDLRPGRPDTELLNGRPWRAAWSRAVAETGGHREIADLEVRQAVAEHLRQRRGIAADPEDVVLLPGVSAALLALPEACGLVGAQIAVEDPGYRAAHMGLARGGAIVRPVPVDADGLDPGLLTRNDRAVYVTPAHQYPLGGRMPVQRRAALLAWAAETNALIVEDDYDGDFRYDVDPLPPLRSQEGSEERVLYLGTASKILTPTLRVAWAVVPPGRAAALRSALDSWEVQVSGVPVRAVGRFLAGAAIGPHIARAARHYAERRRALVSALGAALPELPVLGLHAGLHVVVTFPAGRVSTSDREIEDDLATHGLLCSALSRYAVVTEASGLVLGYSGLPATQAVAAVAVLRDVLNSAE